jgi:glycosyltransferase involved in cell wall biosynthesis
MTRILIVGSFAESLITFRGPLLEALVAAGHEVFACAPSASSEIRARLSAMGVTYRDVPMNRTGLNPAQDLMTLAHLIGLMRELRPEIFLGYTIKPVIYGALAAAVAGVPRRYAMITGVGYAFAAGPEDQSPGRRLIGHIARSLYGLGLGVCERVFFQNPDDRDLFVSLGLIKDATRTVIVNGSGVDLSHYEVAPLPESTDFLLIARLLKDKGIGEYVEAARILRRRYDHPRFRLVGWIDDNPMAIDRTELDRWVAEGIIDYLGRLDDVRPAIADCAVYVLPSYREGTPRTVLEAMAMGRPVITTDAPGCRETIVDGESGYLVPVADAEGLAEAMGRFIDDPSLIETMGARARARAEEKYDVHRVNDVILSTMGL